jgi:hypothetical protein
MWFGGSKEDEGNEGKSEQDLEMMLYENLNSDEKYPSNFTDTIFSRKQFIAKYCYAACITYGYPRDSITIHSHRGGRDDC